jgi:hypothetical protein
MYCAVWNDSEEPLLVFGPHHESEIQLFPTSLYVLPAALRTPRFWDCKGVLIPLGRVAKVKDRVIEGPVALKYRDLRRVRIQLRGEAYLCPRPDGIFSSVHIAMPVPKLNYEQILAFSRRTVRIK